MRALPLALAALLLAGVAGAHVQHDRPYLQATEAPREVMANLTGTTARFDLSLAPDPLRDFVRHTFDPARGVVRVEHRDHASGGSAAFAEWRLLRVIEYRDDNLNFVYDAGDDVVRAWRLGGYPWNATGPRSVTVGGQAAQSVLWTGAVEGGPFVAFEVAAAGRQVSDEGALARSQDALIYLDLLNFTGRGVGHLYAIQAELAAPEDAIVARDADEARTYGVAIDVGGRRAFLVWGAEALLDGAEQPVLFSLGEPVVAGGNATWSVAWSFPSFDRNARMVMVSAIEYPLPQGRPSPAGGAATAALALALVAILLAARRRVT